MSMLNPTQKKILSFLKEKEIGESFKSIQQYLEQTFKITVQPETLNQQLVHMISQGIIQKAGNNYQITDKGLNKEAENE